MEVPELIRCMEHMRRYRDRFTAYTLEEAARDLSIQLGYDVKHRAVKELYRSMGMPRADGPRDVMLTTYNGEHSVNGAEWTLGPSPIKEGDTLRVRNATGEIDLRLG